MSLNYGSLEEVHGAPFGKRVPITQQQGPDKNEPLAKPEFTSLSKRSAESVEKNKEVLDSVMNSLPLDTEKTTENFSVRYVENPAPVEKRMAVRERFTERPISHADAAAEDKLTRILRLIEQNRTGYERPAIQDMVLYVFTGVFFLFTFDTFVQLGKSMRKIKA
jgi:hypothetical protein